MAISSLWVSNEIGFLPTLTLFVTVLLHQVSKAQYCEALERATVADAVHSLDNGEIHTGGCARAAIPILLKHLEYRWPWSNEPHGLHSYPTVEALADIGLAAEPPLIEFVAQNENEGSIEHVNTMEALALIHHSDVVPVVRLLRERSLPVTGTPAVHCLDSAAEYMLRTYCPPKLRKRCEERLRQPDSEK